MRDDDAPDRYDDEKRQKTDIELIRLADRGDEEAFEILVSQRLRHLYFSLLDWCDLASAKMAYPEVANLTINVAVEYARHIKAEYVSFEPPDWLGRIARIALTTWLDKAELKSPDWEDSRSARLTHEEQLRRLKDGRVVRKHFDRLLTPGHREILDRVMIEGNSPEEAGREMGMGEKSALVAPIIYRAVRP